MAVTVTHIDMYTANTGRYFTTPIQGLYYAVPAGSTLVVLVASFWAASVAVPTLYTQPPSQSRGVYLVGTGFQPPALGTGGASADCQRMTMFQIPIIGSAFQGTLTFDFGAKPQYAGDLNAPVVCVMTVSGLGGYPSDQIKQWSTFNTNVPLHLNPVQDLATSQVWVAYAAWGNSNTAGATWTNSPSGTPLNLNGNFFLHQRATGSLPPVYASVTPTRSPYVSHVGIVFELAGVDTTAPGKPTNLRIDGATATTASMSWDSVEDSDKVQYRVYKNGVDLGYTKFPQYTYTGLTPGTTYSFSVKAEDYYVNLSALSDVVSYTAPNYSSTLITDRKQKGVEVLLYDPTGTTVLMNMPLAKDINWQEEISKPGSASFSVPLSANYPIVDGSIVKFKYKGDIRFGCVIKSEACVVATDGKRWLKYENQPGIGAILSNALLYPEGATTNTLPKFIPKERTFGFMSRLNAWYNAANWSTPWAVAWADSTNLHYQWPTDFGYIDPSVMWLSATSAGPNGTVPDTEVQYFRGTFQTVDDTYLVKVVATGDNTVTVWLDGVKVIEANDSNNWMEVQQADASLPPGLHVLAAKVENQPWNGPTGTVQSATSTTISTTLTTTNTLAGYALKITDGTGAGQTRTVSSSTVGMNTVITVPAWTTIPDSSSKFQLTPGSPNPVAFAAVIAHPMPGVDGAIDGVLFHTDSINWVASNVPVGWFGPSVLLRAIKEAKARNVFGMNKITVGFTDTKDSSDTAWSLKKQDFSLPIGKNVLEIAQQLTEDEWDWGFDYKNMRVLAWPRQGTDRSTGATPVRLFAGKDLMSLETSKTYARATVILSQKEDGTWQQTFRPEDLSIERYELALDLGGASTTDTAATQALSLLKEHAYPMTTIEGDVSDLGPQAYVDLFLGDTVLAPGHRGIGVLTQRVMSITVDATGDAVVVKTHLAIDSSSTAFTGGGDFHAW